MGRKSCQIKSWSNQIMLVFGQIIKSNSLNTPIGVQICFLAIKSNPKSNQGVENYVKSNHDQIKSCSYLVKSSNQHPYAVARSCGSPGATPAGRTLRPSPASRCRYVVVWWEVLRYDMSLLQGTNIKLNYYQITKTSPSLDSHSMTFQRALHFLISFCL